MEKLVYKWDDETKSVISKKAFGNVDPSFKNSEEEALLHIISIKEYSLENSLYELIEKVNNLNKAKETYQGDLADNYQTSLSLSRIDEAIDRLQNLRNYKVKTD